jgi:uncharacterized protein
MRGWVAQFALFVVLGALWSTEVRSQPAPKFDRSELTIETATGAHRFQIELALTPEQMSYGLMHRRTLAVDAGMLFDYVEEQQIAMWMKNTFIPLDMLFIRVDGTIARIVERTIPQSLDTIPSVRPVRAVLELNGGTVSRLGIKQGDRVRHPLFAAKP